MWIHTTKRKIDSKGDTGSSEKKVKKNERRNIFNLVQNRNWFQPNFHSHHPAHENTIEGWIESWLGRADAYREGLDRGDKKSQF